MDLDVRSVDESTIRRWDGLVLFWIALWLVLGGWTGYTLWQLSELGDTVTTSGQAIGSTGDALEALGDVPVVGDRTAELGAEVVAAGADVSDRGQRVRSELRQLAVLLGVAIVLLPTTPVVGFYLPLRIARRRELAGVRRLVRSPVDSAATDRYLAERALSRLSPDDLHQLEADPWGAVAAGRTRRLADAELARLGLHRPRE